MSGGFGTLALVISAVGGLLMGGTALINSLLSRPKLRADAMQLATTAATEQINNLRSDNTELRGRADDMETKLDSARVKADSANTKLDSMLRRLTALDSNLQDAHEQNDLLAEQLEEERQSNKLLTASLATAQAQLHAALAELQNAKDQILVLTEHARRIDVWLVRHYSENGHTNEKDKPPTLTPFDVLEEGTP
jgi:chromosome segregation ATPase